MHTIDSSHYTPLSNPTNEKMLVCYRREEDHKRNSNINYLNSNLIQLFNLNKDIAKRPNCITFRDIRKDGNSIQRFRVFNNNFFAHMEGLNYSSFSVLQKENKEIYLRLMRLAAQVEFATKYRCLTFKLSLLAVKSKKLIISKDKTIMQGSYYSIDPNRIKRVPRSKSKAPRKTKKSFNECHISCLPNVYDNSKMSKIISEFITLLKNDQDLDIDAFINNHFQNNVYKKTIEIALKLFSFSLKKETFLSKRNDLFLEISNNNDKSTIKDNHLEQLILNLGQEKNLKLDQPEYALIKKYHDLLIKKQNTTHKKSKSIKYYKDKLKTKNTPLLYSQLILLSMNNFDYLEKYVYLFKEKDRILIKEFHDLTPPKDNPEEGLLRATSKCDLSESIVPLNSILGLMLSATLSMPAEINKGIDAAIDKTHVQVTKLLTEFSLIDNPSEQDFETYMTKYIDLLRVAYTSYRNTKARNNTVPQLEDVIERIRTVSDSSMESFLKNNKASIASYCLKHLKYDEAFERWVTGQITTDGSDIIKPLVEFQSCDKCKII